MFGREGLFGSRKPDEEAGTANGFFIQTQLLPLLIQLQKATRGRKFREIQDSLQGAVTSLLSFQSEEWPPKCSHESATGTMDEDAIEIFTTSTEMSEMSEASAERDGPLQTDAETKIMTPDQCPSDDDPQTREPMHEAVVSVLEALMAVIGHPSKTPNVCELALDGITRLVNKRYVSGQAGSSRKEPTDPSVLHRVLESVAKCSENTAAVAQAAVLSTLRAIMISPKCGVHENVMLMVLRTTFHVYLVVNSETNREMARETLQDILRVIFTRMEVFEKRLKSWQSRREAFLASTDKVDDTKKDDSPSKSKDAPSGQEEHLSTLPDPNAFPSQYHHDCYALFRILCKMSSKELPADTADEPDRARILFASSQSQTDPLALNSKILALECILVALESHCGPAFCQSDKCVHLVQHYLCVSLLKNCVSHHTQVAFVSQKIFVVLIHKFKGQLKEEIAVFLSNVFLRVLDSPNMSFKQKAVVLESLRCLCGDPILLTQIFLHYDCDFDAPNLYKDIVHSLTKLGGKTTSSTPSVNKKEAEQEFELSLASMEVLVTILKAFLQALGLHIGDKGEADDLAGVKIREMLHLNVKLASNDKNVGSQHKTGTLISGNDSVSSSDAPSSQSAVLSVAKVTEAETSAEDAGRIVDVFETKRRAEQNFEIGAVKFTLSLKNGLLFFIENKFVDLDARAIAHFFLVNRDKLDKTQMGEALGREPDAAFSKEEGVDPDKGGPGFWLRILHHYVDAQEFTGLLFDDAIRSFLSGFRLPGEAQKIDRIMEKFAERYTSQNPEVFPSADTAFILAFSVIMLNTDLHNPSIKPEKRMTVDSFIKNNRGIGDNGSDLPEDFLRGIFDRIKEKPFSLKEDDVARERAGVQTQRQLFDASAFFDRSADT